MRMQIRLAILIICVSTLVSCASGMKYTQLVSQIPTVQPNVGRIFFYRDRSMAGALIQADIKLNGEVVGRSVPGGVFYVDKPPGNYEVTCTTEAQRSVTFTLAAGEVRYVRTKIAFGVLVGRLHPVLEDEEQAQKVLTKASYIGDKSF